MIGKNKNAPGGKSAFLTEARRRAVVLFQTRSLSLVQRIHVMDEILTRLDAALNGTESLSEAYASIEAVLQGPRGRLGGPGRRKGGQAAGGMDGIRGGSPRHHRGGIYVCKSSRNSALAIEYILPQTHRQR